MPTIKEIADRCGVTKPTVKTRLMELELWDGHVNTSAQPYVVDDYAASAVSASFADSPDKRRTAEPETPQTSPASDAIALRCIEALEAQLAAKDRQIAELMRINAAQAAEIHALGRKVSRLSTRIASMPRPWWSRMLPKPDDDAESADD